MMMMNPFAKMMTAMEYDPEGTTQQVAVIMTGKVYRDAGLKHSKHPEVEGPLYDTLCKINKHKLRDEVRSLAKNIAVSVRDQEFKPTVEWLDNFMRRFCLSKKKMGFHSMAMLKTMNKPVPKVKKSGTCEKVTQEEVFTALGFPKDFAGFTDNLNSGLENGSVSDPLHLKSAVENNVTVNGSDKSLEEKDSLMDCDDSTPDKEVGSGETQKQVDASVSTPAGKDETQEADSLKLDEPMETEQSGEKEKSIAKKGDDIPKPSVKEDNKTEKGDGTPKPAVKNHSNIGKGDGTPKPDVKKDSMVEKDDGTPKPAVKKDSKVEKGVGTPKPAVKKVGNIEKNGNVTPKPAVKNNKKTEKSDDSPKSAVKNVTEKSDNTPKPVASKDIETEKSDGTPNSAEEKENENEKSDGTPKSTAKKDNSEKSDGTPKPDVKKDSKTEKSDDKPKSVVKKDSKAEKSEGTPKPAIKKNNKTVANDDIPKPKIKDEIVVARVQAKRKDDVMVVDLADDDSSNNEEGEDDEKTSNGSGSDEEDSGTEVNTTEEEEGEQQKEKDGVKCKKKKEKCDIQYSKGEDKYYRKNIDHLQERLNANVVRCTSCYEQVNHQLPNLVYTHPELGIFICKRCRKYYGKGKFYKDEDGYDEYCRLCAEGGDLLCCEQEGCFNGFCKRCIKRILGRMELRFAEKAKNWSCYVCDKTPFMEHRGLHRLIIDNLKEEEDKEANRSRKQQKDKNTSTKFAVLKKNRHAKAQNSSPKKKSSPEKIAKSPEKKPKSKCGEPWLRDIIDNLADMLELCHKNVVKIDAIWGKNDFTRDASEKTANRILKQLDAMEKNFSLMKEDVSSELVKMKDNNSSVSEDVVEIESHENVNKVAKSKKSSNSLEEDKDHSVKKSNKEVRNKEKESTEAEGELKKGEKSKLRKNSLSNGAKFDKKSNNESNTLTENSNMEVDGEEDVPKEGKSKNGKKDCGKRLSMRSKSSVSGKDDSMDEAADISNNDDEAMDRDDCSQASSKALCPLSLRSADASADEDDAPCEDENSDIGNDSETDNNRNSIAMDKSSKKDDKKSKSKKSHENHASDNETAHDMEEGSHVNSNSDDETENGSVSLLKGIASSQDDDNEEVEEKGGKKGARILSSKKLSLSSRKSRRLNSAADEEEDGDKEKCEVDKKSKDKDMDKKVKDELKKEKDTDKDKLKEEKDNDDKSKMKKEKVKGEDSVEEKVKEKKVKKTDSDDEGDLKEKKVKKTDSDDEGDLKEKKVKKTDSDDEGDLKANKEKKRKRGNESGEKKSPRKRTRRQSDDDSDHSLLGIGSSDDEKENVQRRKAKGKGKVKSDNRKKKLKEDKKKQDDSDDDDEEEESAKTNKKKQDKSKNSKKEVKLKNKNDEALSSLLASDSEGDSESNKKPGDKKTCISESSDMEEESSKARKKGKDKKDKKPLDDNEKAKGALLMSESDDDLADKPKPKSKKKNYNQDRKEAPKKKLSEEEMEELKEKQLKSRPGILINKLCPSIINTLEKYSYVNITEHSTLQKLLEEQATYDGDIDDDDSDQEFSKLMRFNIDSKPGPKSKKKSLLSKLDEDDEEEEDDEDDENEDEDDEEEEEEENQKKDSKSDKEKTKVSKKKKEGLLDIDIDKDDADQDDEEDEDEEGSDGMHKKGAGKMDLNEKLRKKMLMSSDEEEDDDEEMDGEDGRNKQEAEKEREKHEKRKIKQKEKDNEEAEEAGSNESKKEGDESESDEEKKRVHKKGYMKLDLTSDEDDDDVKADTDDDEDDEEDKDGDDSDDYDDDSDFEESPRKRRAFQISSSDSEDEDGEKKKKKKKRKKNESTASESENDEELETPKSKRRRIRKASSSSDEEGGEKNENEETPGKKKIRRVIRDEDLMETTKNATQEEEERMKRIEERQKKFNQIFEVDVDTDQEDLGKLVLDFDPDTKKELVKVNDKLVKSLKPHQFKGIKFMWDSTCESIEMLEKKKGSGCILAHCMGLGKTLQVIAFVHTLLTNKHTNDAVQRVMVCCPVNTVYNWVGEFSNWLKGKMMPFDVTELVSAKDLWARAYRLDDWWKEGGVCIMGYDMFRNLSNPKSKRFKGKMKEIFQKSLVDPGPDMIVCDEGHILKNEKTALSVAINKIKTLRRIILTGTPLQNNLKEYHCMIQFVKPNLLGTKKEFMNRFVNPIEQGQCAEADQRDVKRMKRRAHILHNMLEGCVQRFDYTVLKPFLPPKFEYVISVQLSEIQIKLYQYYLDNLAQGGPKRHGSGLFVDFGALSRVWTHPKVLDLAVRRAMLTEDDDELEDFICDDTETEESSEDERSKRKKKNYKDEDDEEEEEEVIEEEEVDKDEAEEPGADGSKQKNGKADNGAGPIPGLTASGKVRVDWWKKVLYDNVGEDFEEDEYLDKMEHSGKLILLLEILRECCSIGDKVLVFSQSLLALDMMEEFLEFVDRGQLELPELEEPLTLPYKKWKKDRDYLRLDGSTSADMRKQMCKAFNSTTNERCRLFLISTRAGGLGINLVGANRVIIFDSSWNPSHDSQSIFRVYRFGQKKPCYVYRFVAQGTMEEKIYSRQVTKMSTALRVVDEHQIKRYFKMADLQQLYEFTPADAEERETPAVPEDRLLAELLKRERGWIVNYHEQDSLLENQTSEELSEEERKAAWEDYENEKKGMFYNQQKNSVVPVVGNMMATQAGMSNLSLAAFSFESVVNTIKNQNPSLSQNDLCESVILATKQIQRIHLNHYQRVQGMVYNLKNPMIAPEARKLLPFGNHPEMLPMLEQQLRLLEENIQKENQVINHMSQITPQRKDTYSSLMAAGLVRGQPAASASTSTSTSTATATGPTQQKQNSTSDKQKPGSNDVIMLD